MVIIYSFCDPSAMTFFFFTLRFFTDRECYGSGRPIYQLCYIILCFLINKFIIKKPFMCFFISKSTRKIFKCVFFFRFQKSIIYLE